MNKYNYRLRMDQDHNLPSLLYLVHIKISEGVKKTNLIMNKFIYHIYTILFTFIPDTELVSLTDERIMYNACILYSRQKLHTILSLIEQLVISH